MEKPLRTKGQLEMDHKISIRELLKRYNEGEYKTNNVLKMCDAGWHDWFCKDEQLRTRLKPKERISNFLKMKEELEEKKFNIHQVPIPPRRF